MYDPAIPLLDSDGIERGPHLHGAEAKGWMLRRGYLVEAADSFEIYADSFAGDAVRLSRLRHSPALVAPIPERNLDNPSWTRFIVTLEGGVDVDRNATALKLPVGATVALRAGHQFQLLAESDSTRLELYFRYDIFLRYGLSVRSGVVLEDAAHARAILALVNILFTPGVSVSAGGAHHLRMAIEHSAIGFLRETIASRQGGRIARAGERSLYARALDEIDRGYNRDGFGVASLADSLHVSERYLRQSFSAEGTTPLLAIRAARAARARDLLGPAEAGEGVRMTEIARLSGFPSARAMRSALTATSSDWEPPANS